MLVLIRYSTGQLVEFDNFVRHFFWLEWNLKPKTTRATLLWCLVSNSTLASTNFKQNSKISVHLIFLGIGSPHWGIDFFYSAGQTKMVCVGMYFQNRPEFTPPYIVPTPNKVGRQRWPCREAASELWLGSSNTIYVALLDWTEFFGGKSDFC